MEVKGAALLYTLAGLMITFAGFSALFLTIRSAVGARLSVLDRYLAKTVMTHIFILTGAALLPPLLALYEVPEKSIWQDSAVLFALPMLVLQVSYPYRRRKVIGVAPPPAIIAVFVVFGACVTLAMLVSVLAGSPYSAAGYLTALTLDFFSVAFAFLVALDVILEQPIQATAPQSKKKRRLRLADRV
jgi:hypothetical protein